MPLAALLENLEIVAGAPGGIERLRRAVLMLAVRGRLVPQVPSENPVDPSQLAESRDRLIRDGVIKKPRHPQGEPVLDEPYPVPASWRWLRLGDAGAIVGGGTPDSMTTEFWAEGKDIPWLTPADMRPQQSRYVTRGERDITAEGLAQSSAQLLPEGTVLFSSRAPIGHVGIAANPLSTNQGFKSVVPYDGVTSEFAYLFLRHIAPQVDADASGTTFKEVSGKDVALIPIPIPPQQEQNRIATRTDELLGLIDELETQREARHLVAVSFRSSSLDALATADSPDALATAWRRVSDNFPNITFDPDAIGDLRSTILRLGARGVLGTGSESDGPAEVLLQQLRKERDAWLEAVSETVGEATTMLRKLARCPDPEPPFPLPERWTCARLIDLCTMLVDCHNKTAPYVPDGIPLVRTSNIREGRIQWLDMKHVDEQTYAFWSRRCPPEPGDIIFTREAPMGEAAIVPAGLRVCLGQRTMLIRPATPHVDPDYLLLALREPGLLERAMRHAVGATVKHFRVGDVERLNIALPPLPEQRRIVERVATLQALCDALEEQLRGSSRLCEAFSATLAASGGK